AGRYRQSNSNSCSLFKMTLDTSCRACCRSTWSPEKAEKLPCDQEHLVVIWTPCGVALYNAFAGQNGRSQRKPVTEPRPEWVMQQFVKSKPDKITKADKTKARLVDVAKRLVQEHGSDRVTLRDIAAAARMKAGSIYYHFESRD